MRIPEWSPEGRPHAPELIQSILARRGGELLNLDKALLWSEPVTRGWNAFFQNIRGDLSISRKFCELGICTVALLSAADYEFYHHAPEFLKAGGTQAELDALKQAILEKPSQGVSQLALDSLERLVVQYAAQITQEIRVQEELFTALRSHFTPTALIELTTVIAAYNMVARVLLPLNIMPESSLQSSSQGGP